MSSFSQLSQAAKNLIFGSTQSLWSVADSYDERLASILDAFNIPEDNESLLIEKMGELLGIDLYEYDEELEKRYEELIRKGIIAIQESEYETETGQRGSGRVFLNASGSALSSTLNKKRGL